MTTSQHPWQYHLSSFLFKQASPRHPCDSQVQWDPNHHACLCNARVKNVAPVEPNGLSGSIRLTVCWVLFLNEESGAGVSYFLMLRVGTSSLSWSCTQELVPGSKVRESIMEKRSCCAVLTQAGKLGSGGACPYRKGGLAALVLSLNVCNAVSIL